MIEELFQTVNNINQILTLPPVRIILKASANYAIIPNSLDTKSLSQNMQKAFSTAHDQTSIEMEMWTFYL